MVSFPKRLPPHNFIFSSRHGAVFFAEDSCKQENFLQVTPAINKGGYDAENDNLSLLVDHPPAIEERHKISKPAVWCLQPSFAVQVYFIAQILCSVQAYNPKLRSYSAYVKTKVMHNEVTLRRS